MAIREVSIQCGGVDAEGRMALEHPIPVTVTLSKRAGSKSIAAGPHHCPYNTGGHGQRCRASHPDKNKVGDGAFCQYSFDHPHVLSHKPGWKPPEEIEAAFNEVLAE